VRVIRVWLKFGDGNMLDNAYHWLLYNLGFQVDEHISDLLARQKLRWGWAWWFAPIISMLVTVLFLGFQIWLTIHIIYFQLKKKE